MSAAVRYPRLRGHDCEPRALEGVRILAKVWCFAFAGVGWAVGGQWESFRYADYASVALVVALAGAALAHRRREHA